MACSFEDGVDVFWDGKELHLTSFCLADADLRLTGVDNPAFGALKVQYVDVLGGAPQNLPPDRWMEASHGARARDGRRPDAEVPGPAW